MDARIQAGIPLPAPLPTVAHDGTPFDAVRVVYRMTHIDGRARYEAVPFGTAPMQNATIFAWFDLPDGIPDAPQWLVDAAESLLDHVGAEAGAA